MREKRYLITISFYKMSDLVSKDGWLYITERERKPEKKVWRWVVFGTALACRHRGCCRRPKSTCRQKLVL